MCVICPLLLIIIYTAVQTLYGFFFCRKFIEIPAARWLLWHSDFTTFNFGRCSALVLAGKWDIPSPFPAPSTPSPSCSQVGARGHAPKLMTFLKNCISYMPRCLWHRETDPGSSPPKPNFCIRPCRRSHYTLATFPAMHTKTCLHGLFKVISLILQIMRRQNNRINTVWMLEPHVPF